MSGQAFLVLSCRMCTNQPTFLQKKKFLHPTRPLRAVQESATVFSSPSATFYSSKWAPEHLRIMDQRTNTRNLRKRPLVSSLCASLSHGLSTALSCARLHCSVHGQEHDLRRSFHAPVAVNRKQLQRLWKRFNLLDSTGNGIITRCKP